MLGTFVTAVIGIGLGQLASSLASKMGFLTSPVMGTVTIGDLAVVGALLAASYFAPKGKIKTILVLASATTITIKLFHLVAGGLIKENVAATK